MDDLKHVSLALNLNNTLYSSTLTTLIEFLLLSLVGKNLGMHAPDIILVVHTLSKKQYCIRSQSCNFLDLFTGKYCLHNYIKVKEENSYLSC